MNQRRLMLYSCFAVTFAAGLSGTLLGPTFQSLAEKFDMPIQSSGIFTGLQFIGITITVLGTGWLLDRINARYALIFGSLFMGSGLLMLSVAAILPIALFGALILGFGYGIVNVGANIVVGALNAQNTGAALNRLSFFYGLGAICSPQLVNFALMQNNFTLAFSITALFSLVLIIPFSQTSLHIHTEKQVITRGTIHWIVLLPFALILCGYVGIEVGFSSWIPTQLSIVAHSVESIATLGTSLFWLGLTSMRLVASFILRRLTEQQMLVAALLTVGCGMLVLLSFPTSQTLTLICAFIVGFGCGTIFPSTLALGSTIYPQVRGVASGLLLAAGTFGGSLFPWIQGQVGAGQNGGMIVVLLLDVLMFGALIYGAQMLKQRAILDSEGA